MLRSMAALPLTGTLWSSLSSSARRVIHSSVLTLLPHKLVAPQSVRMPDTVSGRVTVWMKKVGDAVRAGEPLCEIETKDATIVYQSSNEGVLAQIVAQPTIDVRGSEEIATLVPSLGDLAALLSQSLGGDKASPSARHLILSQHPPLDPSGIRGSGKGGRITKGDVLVALGRAPAPAPATEPHHTFSRVNLPDSPAAPAAPAAAAPAAAPAAAAVAAPKVLASAPSPAPSTSVGAAAGAGAPSVGAGGAPGGGHGGRPVKDTKASMVRKVISARLTESKATVPHFYVSIDCRIDSLLGLRKTLKSVGSNVSVNDMVVKAAGKALRLVPEVNCYWDAKVGGPAARPTVDVSVAVATDGGLITPIVKSADSLGLQNINDTIKDLATRARAGKLKPEEYQGGSFTISNMGMFGVDEFTAVINPPQSCILAVASGVAKPVFEEEFGGPESDTPVVATVMTVTLSCDRRVVDEAIAAQFLATLRSLLQTPALLM